jgi:hypothetical protein
MSKYLLGSTSGWQLSQVLPEENTRIEVYRLD